MPYPAILLKEESATEKQTNDTKTSSSSPAFLRLVPAVSERVHQEEAQIFQLPVWPNSRATTSVGASSQERIWAHAIDAVIVHGFSIYIAKWSAVLLALNYKAEFVSAGKNFQNLYVNTLNHSMLPLWLMSFTAISFIYVVTSHHWWGRTFGKALLGLRVVNSGTGARPDFKSCMKRYGAYLITYLSLGAGFWFFKAHEQFTDTKVLKEE